MGRTSLPSKASKKQVEPSQECRLWVLEPASERTTSTPAHGIGTVSRPAGHHQEVALGLRHAGEDGDVDLGVEDGEGLDAGAADWS